MATSVGAYLREIRLSRGLTLEQASQATHIRKSYLEALENEQPGELPSAVQGRGFLRLYAGYLNLPSEALVKSWDSKTPLNFEETGGAANLPAPTSEAPLPVEEALPPAEAAPPPTETTRKAGTGPLPRLPEPASEIQAAAGPIPVEFQEASGAASEASGSQAIFAEIGARLRKQRELLGLSRAEIERYTRLRQHYIQALEEGRMDLLPSPVQGRGMLSNYATFLNLDEETLMLRFAEGLQMRRVERIPATPLQPQPAKRRPARAASPLRRFLTPDLVFGVVVITAILLFAARTAFSINDAQKQEAQPTTRAIVEVLLTPDETQTIPSTPVEGAGIEGGTAQATPDGGETATGSQTQAAVVEDVTATPTLAPTVAPINHDPLQVYIIANQRAYLRVMVDNKEKFNGRVAPGNAYAFSGAKRIELLTGNAAALQVYYNQNDLGTLGVAGQVVDLIFVPGSVVTATPVLTSTPTPGVEATETIQPSATARATATVTPLIP